jgi:hexaprenyl-diphosphate synthase
MNFLRPLVRFVPGKNYQFILSRASTLVGEQLQKPARKELLGDDLRIIKDNIFKLLGSDNLLLDKISSYYFSQGGKHVRPMLVLLISKATNHSHLRDDTLFNDPIEQTSRMVEFKDPEYAHLDGGIMPSQRRLAEITEMIHTASLLHDDVIDKALTRRGVASANHEYGNKLAILAGDFLLARASVGLARLRNVAVVELLATVISNLVEGEFMQLRNTPVGEFKKQLLPVGYNPSEVEQSPAFQYYLEKTYLKTASLISKSCQAATVLNGSNQNVRDAALGFGRNLGIAFQVIQVNSVG